MSDKKSETRAETTATDQQAPDTQQPGVSHASQDWEEYRANTPEAQDQPSALDRPEQDEKALAAEDPTSQSGA